MCSSFELVYTPSISEQPALIPQLDDKTCDKENVQPQLDDAPISDGRNRSRHLHCAKFVCRATQPATCCRNSY